MDTDKALSRAAALCSRSEQCESDIRAKLLHWDVETSEADAIISRLRHDHFIDDERYARAYVHDKFLYNGWGPVKLTAMLRQKRLQPDAIEQALEQFTHDDYSATLQHLLTGKHRSMASRDPRLARAALLRFAASRGYDAHMAYQVVGLVMGNDDEDFD